MSGGRHRRTIHQLRSRVDAVIEADRERRRPPPPPISPKHAALRARIERAKGALHEQIPEGTDVEEALAQSDELANFAARILVLIREEQDFLAGQGVDSRPYTRY